MGTTVKPKALKLKFWDAVKLLEHGVQDLTSSGNNESVPLASPRADHPVCLKCGRDKCGSKTPYFKNSGTHGAKFLFVLSEPSQKDEAHEAWGKDGQSGLIRRIVNEEAEALGIKLNPEDMAWTASNLCRDAFKTKKDETTGKHCLHWFMHTVKSINPQVIVPIGTASLKLLSHKSNPWDWQGRLLTWRGIPDSWLTDEKFTDGHPYWKNGGERKPIYPLLSPLQVFGTRNPVIVKRWRAAIKNLLVMTRDCTLVNPVYDRPWWRIEEDSFKITSILKDLAAEVELDLTFDTETTGLNPWAFGARIVTWMLRWTGSDGIEKLLAVPWDYEASPINKEDRDRISHLLLDCLCRHRTYGHNLTFDILWAIATLPGGRSRIDDICGSMASDTWHMAFVRRQQLGSLGLERLCYDWAQGVAGYEEEFELLKDRTPSMQPENGGHYANCPRELWTSHYRPYVCGDVEAVHIARPKLRDALQDSQRYPIPVANRNRLGNFINWTPMGRSDVYAKIVEPVSRTLAKMMARGMFIDISELDKQEIAFPNLVKESRSKVGRLSPAIENWSKLQTTVNPSWELDLENKNDLKHIIYTLLDLPITTLTKAGAAKYRDKPITDIPAGDLQKYASTSKFTLNSMAIKNPGIRDLLEYRKVYKQYTSFVRSMRNITTAGIDKNDRKKDPYLQPDGFVHSTFKITGTRSGRLSSSNPNLQQLPRDSAVKKMYVSRFGSKGCIWQSDLSQIELRLLASISGDEAMCRAYWNNLDLHSQTTSLIFKIPYENFTDEYTEWLQKSKKDNEIKELSHKRKIGKTANFLTGYGGGAIGLQSSLAANGVYLELTECEQILDLFFDTYCTLKNHIGVYKNFILSKGVAVSMFGRVRVLEEAWSDDRGLSNKALRAGCNHLIQSTASDLMFIALNAIEHCMRDRDLRSLLVSTVHDSLVIDAVQDELPVIHEICDGVLRNMPTVLKMVLGEDFDADWLLVPIEADHEVGLDYLSSRKIINSNPDWTKLLSR